MIHNFIIILPQSGVRSITIHTWKYLRMYNISGARSRAKNLPCPGIVPVFVQKEDTPLSAAAIFCNKEENQCKIKTLAKQQY